MTKIMQKLKKVVATVSAAITSTMLTVGAYAAQPTTGGELASSKAYTGTQSLLNDLSGILLVAAPIVGTACIIYFAIRRSAADEMDQKKWNQRIIIAIVSIIIAVVASSLISVITSYYT